MKKCTGLLLAVAMLASLAACGSAANAPKALPPASPDPESQFGVDLNINIDTIDDYLNRDDVAYRDMRMLFDPADYAAIGGNADLSMTLEGFRIVPYPYLASLSQLPVSGAYDGETLYTLTWNEDGSIASATPNYVESPIIMEELFPKDKAIFLICGGGGYAGMTKQLLVFLGWDASKIATWRADYAYIDFSRLHKVS